MAALPRSVRLACWTTAWLRGDVSLDDVVDRVVGDDEPHDVVPTVDPDAEPRPLVDTLVRWRQEGVRGVRALLPAAGDTAGLSGPVDLTRAAVDAGEVAVAIEAPFALVPAVTAFGPPGDEGHLVRWHEHPAEPVVAALSLAEADRGLRHALHESSTALADLDVASWRPEVAEVLVDLRTARTGEPLPRGYSGPAQALAAQALRLWTVVELALDDDGGSISAGEAAERRAALRELETASRHALAAVTDPRG